MHFLWAAAYGLTYTISGRLSGKPLTVSLAMLVYTGGLLLWIIRTKQHKAIGLGIGGLSKARDYRDLLPLLLLPACNLLTAGGYAPTLSTLLLMLSVCAVEEIFFRGFLLRRLAGYGQVPALLLSSAAFGLFHFVNLAGGSDFAYTLTQVCCAFAAGLCYGAAAILYGSLIPGFIAHYLTNITGSPGEASPWLWLCIAACGFFGIRLCGKIRQSYKENQL